MVTHDSFIWIRRFEVFGEDSGEAVEDTAISPQIQGAFWELSVILVSRCFLF